MKINWRFVFGLYFKEQTCFIAAKKEHAIKIRAQSEAKKIKAEEEAKNKAIKKEEDEIKDFLQTSHLTKDIQSLNVKETPSESCDSCQYVFKKEAIDCFDDDLDDESFTTPNELLEDVFEDLQNDHKQEAPICLEDIVIKHEKVDKTS